MSAGELVARLVSLASEAEGDHPEVASVLYHLLGAMVAGRLRQTSDACAALSAQFIQDKKEPVS